MVSECLGWKIKIWIQYRNKKSVDLYSVDSDGSGGYLAVYDIADDSVHPYEE